MAAVIAVPAIACGSLLDVAPPSSDPSCVTNDDCPSGTLCVEAMCRDVCNGLGSCPAGEACTAVNGGYVCTVPMDATTLPDTWADQTASAPGDSEATRESEVDDVTPVGAGDATGDVALDALDGSLLPDAADGSVAPDAFPVDASDADVLDVADVTSDADADAGPPGCGPLPACGAGSCGARVMLTGGVADQVVQNDTWEWTGAQWTTKNLVGTAPQLWAANGAVFCDRPWIFGGSATRTKPYSNVLWNWDGLDWRQSTPSTGPIPPARILPGVAAFNGTIVLFGGFTSGTTGQLYLSDTWVWDGSIWTQKSPTSAPSGRESPFMATVGGQVVLFGGADNANTFNDTWFWDGSNWTQPDAQPDPSPPAREMTAGAAVDDTMVIFGGVADDGSALGDTWQWDGATWTDVSPDGSASPPARVAAAAGRWMNQVVLFGGTAGDFVTPLGDTWTWSGGLWTQPPPGPGPSPRFNPVMIGF